jgi:hypothetical protein
MLPVFSSKDSGSWFLLNMVTFFQTTKCHIPEVCNIHNRFDLCCNSRVQYLEQELLTIRSKEHEETATLEKAIEQVEDNLKRTTVSTVR